MSARTHKFREQWRRAGLNWRYAAIENHPDFSGWWGYWRNPRHKDQMKYQEKRYTTTHGRMHQTWNDPKSKSTFAAP